MALVDSLRARRGDKSEVENATVALRRFRDDLTPVIAVALSAHDPRFAKRADLSRIIKETINAEAAKQQFTLSLLQERNLITDLLNEWISTGGKPDAAFTEDAPAVSGEPVRPSIRIGGQQIPAKPAAQVQTAPLRTEQSLAPAPTDGETIPGTRLSDLMWDAEPEAAPAKPEDLGRASVEAAAEVIRGPLTDQIDVSAAAKLSRGELAKQITEILSDILRSKQIQLNSMEQRDLVTLLINDMLGLGPLEALLADESITDIMINGPYQIYVERKGKLTLTDIRFRDNQHLMGVCTRIVNRIGRRVDESSPMCDARLEDGSRVNIIIPPLALDGASVSIRKFSEKKITLEVMTSQNNISKPMETVLKIAGRSRLNILISGGTGSGKTTLLNAMSRMVDTGERVVTIEDAAELQLQQPHVVRLETRPPNLEGRGEITMRDLVKNALRMRPDRIILGEIRGGEAIDMLQAMNTGHDGSMCTIHANNPREALTRLENMVSMAGFNLPAKAMRQQIASAVDLIVQVSRMRDGKRRITSVTEVVGMEGDIITTQELFAYRFKGEDQEGNLLGDFEPAGLRPHFAEKASYFGLERPLVEAMS